LLKLFTNSVPIQLQFNAAEIMAQIPSKSLTKIKEKSLLIGRSLNWGKQDGTDFLFCLNDF